MAIPRRAHGELLREDYCQETTHEALAHGEIEFAQRARFYAACIAPIARGTVLFADNPAQARAGEARGRFKPRAN